MKAEEIKKLRQKMLLLYPAAFVTLAAFLFIPAGTIKYWQGWLFIAVVLVPAFLVSNYLIKKSPELLQRRMRYKEKEMQQKTYIMLSGIVFFLGFVIPGLDFRFGWSQVPVWLVLTSDVIIMLGYYLVFLSFKVNPFAARTVEVFPDHKLIDTGVYAVVRHPMYAGVIPMFLFIPLALGSFWAVLFFIPICPIIIFRTLNEEEVLKRDLAGYRDYCKRVRFRLMPFVW